MGNIHRQRDERISTASHPKAPETLTFLAIRSFKVRLLLPDTSIGVEVPMAEMIHVSEDTFKNEVLDSSQPVLVDFSAVWCQPCKMLDPIVKQLAGEWEGKVKVVKIDADENPNLVMQFGVMGIPTLLFFKSGEIKERITGYMAKEKLIARFSPHFN
jgi:thioredoxin